MKLERINAAAQIELPNARPLRRNHSVSKISAPIPDKKRMPERITMRTLASKFGGERRGTPNVCTHLLSALFGIFAISQFSQRFFFTDATGHCAQRNSSKSKRVQI